jgi:flagellum-specific ATP synthase
MWCCRGNSRDILRSTSRLLGELASPSERELVSEAVRHLAVLERNRQLVELGAYAAGANPALDAALAVEPALFALLRQEQGGATRADALARLAKVVQRQGTP